MPNTALAHFYVFAFQLPNTVISLHLKSVAFAAQKLLKHN